MGEVIEHVYTTNAPKGAERLDDYRPGWANELVDFKIASFTRCAAAQVAGGGNYWDGLEALFPAARTEDQRHVCAVKYGFHADVPEAYAFLGTVDEYNAKFGPAWDALQSDWEHLIDSRRTAVN